MQFDQLKRREFITLLGGAAAAWPLAARGQQPGKLPTIGYLGSGTPATQSAWVAAFVQRLRELGWIEGRTVAIEYRWAEGRDERFAKIAAELVRFKVDVIVTSGTPAVMALKQATSVIPIVFAQAGDPVANNLVASLARPGGNITGLSNQTRELAGKRLELLREVVPGRHRLAILVNVGNPSTVLEMGEAQAAARTLGLDVATLEITTPKDIESYVRGRIVALIGYIYRRAKMAETSINIIDALRGQEAQLRRLLAQKVLISEATRPQLSEMEAQVMELKRLLNELEKVIQDQLKRGDK
jgi:hypothetical protein